MKLFQQFLIKLTSDKSHMLSFSQKQSIKRNLLLKLTPFLPNKTTIRQRAWHVINNTWAIPLCKQCEIKPTIFNRKINNYPEVCSIQCSNRYSKHITIREDAIEKKYGVRNVWQSEAIKEQIKQHWIDLRGVDNVAKSQEAKDKTKSTVEHRYENGHQSRDPVVINKKLKTNNERFGCDNPMQNPIIVARGEATNMRLRGVKHTSQDPVVQATIRATNIKRRGYPCVLQDPVVKEKIKQTNIKRRGVENAAQDPIVIETIRQTNIKRRGVPCVFQDPKIIKQIEEINIERYGDAIPSRTDLIKQRTEDNNIKQYGRIHPNQNHIDKEAIANYSDPEWLIYHHHTLKETLSQMGKDCGVYYTTILNYMNKYNLEIFNHKGGSVPQKEVFDFVIDNGVDAENDNWNIIPKLELDILIPELNLAIEFNGGYWHSISQKSIDYHVGKTNLCGDVGIRLIHIFENDWETKRLQCELLIENACQTNNHNYPTTITTIDQIVLKLFLETYHIYGYQPASFGYALTYDDVIYGVMSFSEDNELIQFLSLGNEVESFNKLFDHAVTIHSNFSTTVYLTHDNLELFKDWNIESEEAPFIIMSGKYEVYNCGSITFSY